MTSSLRVRYAAILALGLSGFVAHQLTAQETAEPPTNAERVGDLIVPRINAPAEPPMTEEEAAALGGQGEPGFNDLTMPDMSAPRSSREYRTCPDREDPPAWAENLGVKEAGRSLLLSEIYKARSYEQIVATGDCSCAVKAPSWDAAEAEYQENYAALDLAAVDEAWAEFQMLSDSFHQDARRICRAQNNW